MTVSQTLGGNASPITCVIAGTEYKFNLLTQKAKSGIERAVQDRARTELFRDKNELGDEEFKLAYGAYMDRISAGAFAFGGAICRQFLSSTSGLETLVKLLAGVSEATAAKLVAEHPDEVATVIGTVFTESFPSTRRQPEGQPGRTETSE